MRYLISLIVIAFAAVSSVRAQEPKERGLLLLQADAIERARTAYAAGGDSANPLIAELMRDARAELGRQLVSVMQKEQVPPSGNKHDYMSLGPYWWPDTTKPNGLPYIRRDGEVNPEYRKYGDNERTDRMREKVFTLALAFSITGLEDYAQRAVRQLSVWFLDPETRMNPHLEYAQAIKGVNTGRGIGIIETYSFRELLDGMILLHSSRAWTPEVDRGMRAWFTSYLDWLLNSPNGKDEAGWKNNHGSAYDVQVSCIAFYLGKREIAKAILQNVGSKRIAVQIEPDGSQPLELERTKSWGYSNMNLDALVYLAVLGERVGVDLWRFEMPDGRSIRRAIDFLLPFALGQKEWPWTTLSPLNPERMYLSTAFAAFQYHDERYRAAHLRWKDLMRASRENLFIPELD